MPEIAIISFCNALALPFAAALSMKMELMAWMSVRPVDRLLTRVIALLVLLTP